MNCNSIFLEKKELVKKKLEIFHELLFFKLLLWSNLNPDYKHRKIIIRWINHSTNENAICSPRTDSQPSYLEESSLWSLPSSRIQKVARQPCWNQSNFNVCYEKNTGWHMFIDFFCWCWLNNVQEWGLRKLSNSKSLFCLLKCIPKSSAMFTLPPPI